MPPAIGPQCELVECFWRCRHLYPDIYILKSWTEQTIPHQSFRPTELEADALWTDRSYVIIFDFYFGPIIQRPCAVIVTYCSDIKIEKSLKATHIIAKSDGRYVSLAEKSDCEADVPP